MAEFEVDFPEDFLSELLDTDFDEIAEEALQETAPILEESMKASCRAAVSHGGDSELVDSIKKAKPKRTKTDAWIINVSPKGYSRSKTYRNKKTGRKYPVSNALKAIWKEYGIPGRQPPFPFIASGCNRVREKIMGRMQEIYNRKVGADES